MRLYYDVDLQTFIRGPNTTSPVDSITLRRSPTALVQIQFFHTSSPTPIQLAAGATGTFEVKEDGKFDADALTKAGSWTPSGSGSTALYSFLLDLQNTALGNLLGINDPVTFTASTITSKLTAAAHGLVNNNIIQLSVTGGGALPAPLQANTDYYVVNKSTNDFQVALTEGGAAITLTTNGTPTTQFRRIDNDLATVPLMAAMEYVESGFRNESNSLAVTYRNDICRQDDTSTPADPEDVILNARVGKPACTSGVDSQAFTFDTPFSGGADVVVVGDVAIPTAGDDEIHGIVIDDTVDENGFTVKYGATIPSSGYKFHYHAIQI